MAMTPWLLLAGLLATAGPEKVQCLFVIQVVDDQTGRGVPLVELRTVNAIRYVTDSGGFAAINEPGLFGQTVYFHVASHGYEFPKDGFGYRGKALQVRPGGRAKLTLRRLNVAQRLYRVTGGGVYRDSVLAGHQAPISKPLLNGQVFGSDSVVNAVYRGRVYWFWGDTNRPAYPLGNFNVPGATSELPGKGGLDPEQGVNLSYFVDKNGFAKATARMPGEGPTWIDGLVGVHDESGAMRLYAKYVKVRAPLTVYRRGLAVYDDTRNQFENVLVYAADTPASFMPGGHPFKHFDGGVEYVYFATPYPLVRVPAAAGDLRTPTHYEAFTCLKPGSRMENPQIDRDRQGRIRYAWRKNTPAVGPAEQTKLIRAGLLKPVEGLLQLRDRDTGQTVLAHSGSVYWNAYRRRWIMIAVQSFGTSVLGEVWYAEAETPVGPWVYTVKVVTHQKYSFYNPKQHPFFDQAGGREVFFEGTYTRTFSGNDEATPRYDYNQIMYKLDLADDRLALPGPVYQASERARFQMAPSGATDRIAFFAGDRPGPGASPFTKPSQPAEPPACRLDKLGGLTPSLCSTPCRATKRIRPPRRRRCTSLSRRMAKNSLIRQTRRGRPRGFTAGSVPFAVFGETRLASRRRREDQQRLRPRPRIDTIHLAVAERRRPGWRPSEIRPACSASEGTQSRRKPARKRRPRPRRATIGRRSPRTAKRDISTMCSTPWSAASCWWAAR